MRFIKVVLLVSFLPHLATAGVCDRIAEKYKKELTVPYHEFTDLSLRKCVDLTQVNANNVELFVAGAFYDNSLKVRKEAMTKLEVYNCKKTKSCETFEKLLDAHIKATTLVQSKTISLRANLLRDRVSPPSPQALTHFCEPQAIASAQAVAKINGSAVTEATSVATNEGKNYKVILSEKRVGKDEYDVLTSGGHECVVFSVTLGGNSPSKRP